MKNIYNRHNVYLYENVQLLLNTQPATRSTKGSFINYYVPNLKIGIFRRYMRYVNSDIYSVKPDQYGETILFFNFRTVWLSPTTAALKQTFCHANHSQKYKKKRLSQFINFYNIFRCRTWQPIRISRIYKNCDIYSQLHFNWIHIFS